MNRRSLVKISPVLCAIVLMQTFTLIPALAQPLVLLHSFGHFKHARCISRDPAGFLYVSDDAAHVVKKFSPTGDEVKSIGGLGWGENQFDNPSGIDARFGIEVYVADYGNHRIQRFDKTLSFIGSLFMRENADPNLRFGYPIDLVISRLGELYFIDSENNRIMKMNSFSTVDRIFGTVESGTGQLASPRGIALGEDEKVYVLENSRIVVFDTFGNYLYDIGKEIFNAAKGFCIAGDTIYLVTEDSLFLWRIDKTLIGKISAKEFLGITEMEKFEDISVGDQKIFLLTTNEVHVFQIPS